jgi:hypothetical protein
VKRGGSRRGRNNRRRERERGEEEGRLGGAEGEGDRVLADFNSSFLLRKEAESLIISLSLPFFLSSFPGGGERGRRGGDLCFFLFITFVDSLGKNRRNRGSR